MSSDFPLNLLETGEKLTKALKELQGSIQVGKIQHLIQLYTLDSLVQFVFKAFINSNKDQLPLSTAGILALINSNVESHLYFLQLQLPSELPKKLSLFSPKSAENMIQILYTLCTRDIGYTPNFTILPLYDFLPEISQEAQISALSMLSLMLDSFVNANTSFSPINLIEKCYQLIDSNQKDTRNICFEVLIKLFKRVGPQALSQELLVNVMNRIPNFTNTDSLISLLQTLIKWMENKEFFYFISDLLFTFYDIPLLEQFKGNQTILKLSLQITINLFPKTSDIPQEFTHRQGKFGINKSVFLSNSAHSVEQLFLAYPDEEMVIAAYMQVSKYVKPNETKAFFEALKKAGRKQSLLPHVLYICSLVTNMSEISKYRINRQIDNYERKQQNSWYSKLLKNVLRKCPQCQSDDAILENGDIEEVLELVGSGVVSSEKLTQGVFKRLSDLLIEHGNIFDLDLTPTIDVAFDILNDLSFDHLDSLWRSGDIDTFTHFKVMVNLIGGERNFTHPVHIISPLAWVEGTYNLKCNQGIVSALKKAIQANPELKKIVVPDFDEKIDNNNYFSTPERLSVLCRIFNVNEYKRYSFLSVKGITYTIDDPISTVIAAQVETLTELRNLQLKLTLVPETEERISLRIPKVELPEACEDILEFLKIIHRMCPNISLKSSDFSKRVMRNIRSPIEAVMRKSPEICFVYTYPFLFQFTDKLFTSKTVLSTPIETAETFAKLHDVKFQVQTIKHKCSVSRTDIYKMGTIALQQCARSSLDVGFYFEGEIGFGTGPTQEFFTLMAKELTKSIHKMWRSDDPKSEFCYSKNGLFPRPDADPNDVYTLGILVSKALQENKIIEMELSTAFTKLIKGEKITVADVDPVLAKSLTKEAAQGLIGLDFTYPGIPEITKPGIDEVTESNLSQYISFIEENTVGQPILNLVKAFTRGFLRNGEISAISLFEDNELSRALSGDSFLFNERDLMQNMTAQHGLNKRSRQFKELVSIIASFTPQQQRQFCKFLTGAERLPPGGLSALKSPITVALKDGDDGTFPTVSTCSYYLKIPSYSNKEIMREKLLYAITNGNTFELS